MVFQAEQTEFALLHLSVYDNETEEEKVGGGVGDKLDARSFQ